MEVLQMNNKRENRPFIESELPLDTVLNPGMMILNERANLEESKYDSIDGSKEGPVEES
jgi:hypothetical protein